MRLYLGAFALAALGLGVAHGRECHGITFAEHVQLQGTDLTLNGLGMREATIFKVSVYVAALYVQQPSHDPRALLGAAPPKQLVMQFVRNVSAKELRERFEEGLARAAGSALPALKDRIALLNGWMRDVRSGDRMTLTWLTDHSVQLELNGQPVGRVPGEDFARVLLSIWLGDQPPNPELKSGLLGGACS